MSVQGTISDYEMCHLLVILNNLCQVVGQKWEETVCVNAFVVIISVLLRFSQHALGSPTGDPSLLKATTTTRLPFPSLLKTLMSHPVCWLTQVTFMLSERLLHARTMLAGDFNNPATLQKLSSSPQGPGREITQVIKPCVCGFSMPSLDVARG